MHCLTDLTENFLDVEKRRQNLCRINPKRQVVAWGPGKKVERMAMAA